MISVQFIDSPDIGYALGGSSGHWMMRGIGKVGDFCLKSRLFSLFTLGHLHTFVHELGHALIYVAIARQSATINMSTASCYGSTTLSNKYYSLNSIAATLVDLAGPLADVAFSVLLIVGVFALTHYIPMAYSLSLALRVGIGTGSLIWIWGEFFYAAVSSYKMDDGDFGKIAERGPSHLLVSAALLVGVVTLGAFGVVQLL